MCDNKNGRKSEKVQQQQLYVLYVCSKEQHADILTKPVSKALLLHHRPKIGVTDGSTVLRGSLLSSRSPDEEYIGDTVEPSWEADRVIKTAFESFSARLKELEATIDERNNDLKNTNRAGAGVVPYELLKPFSESGVTGKRVPNSISI
ncbi:hypothetical protein GH714_003572 [Hevea brasiliensis]|uniref:Lipoxygenase domain-containing protein n=1 Tax=Hevea brasiliensis TaxID=3981 RepID=A0A6A6KYL8_HEVBR|nr:hypothetical protein GH714_003572 [Hevea brasiliensis]